MIIGRGPVTLVAALGAVTAGFAAQASSAPVGSLAWALAAGTGLSLMLERVGLRVVGVVCTALAVIGAAWSGQTGLWVPMVGFIVSAIALLGLFVWGPRWPARAARKSARTLDPWAAMDAGEDPTGEQDLQSHRDSG